MPGVCFESAVDAVFEEVAVVDVIFVSSFVRRSFVVRWHNLDKCKKNISIFTTFNEITTCFVAVRC
jgi:hypothetical protein